MTSSYVTGLLSQAAYEQRIRSLQNNMPGIYRLQNGILWQKDIDVDGIKTEFSQRGKTVCLNMSKESFDVERCLLCLCCRIAACICSE